MKEDTITYNRITGDVCKLDKESTFTKEEIEDLQSMQRNFIDLIKKNKHHNRDIMILSNVIDTIDLVTSLQCSFDSRDDDWKKFNEFAYRITYRN